MSDTGSSPGASPSPGGNAGGSPAPEPGPSPAPGSTPGNAGDSPAAGSSPSTPLAFQGGNAGDSPSSSPGGTLPPGTTPGGQPGAIPAATHTTSPGGTVAASPAATPGQVNAQPSVLGAGMAASLVSAYIQCTDPSLPLPPIEFPYNPEEYSITTKAKWIRPTQPAGNVPPMWGGVEQRSLTVNILLDAFSVPPLPPQVVLDQLKMMMLPTALSLGLDSASAPTVMFGWGPNIIFAQATIEQVTVRYHRFLGGVPVRVTASVLLKEIPLPSPLGATNPTSGGLAPLRTRTLVEGDTLASISYDEYRDPNKWRALAEANKIDDPMRVKAGTVLLVPDRREAESLS